MPGYLLDTNILLRSSDDSSEHFELALGAVQTLLARGETLLLVPQNIYEFWAVATRPTRSNGLGWDVERVQREVSILTTRFTFLPDTQEVFEHWLELVTRFKVKGKQVHDARLVAAMQTHSVENILTLNVKDFERYPVKPVHPEEVDI